MVARAYRVCVPLYFSWEEFLELAITQTLSCVFFGDIKLKPHTDSRSEIKLCFMLLGGDLPH